MGFEASVHAKAIDLTKLAIEMTAEAGSGHPTSGASMSHLVTVLMYGHMRWDPSKPDHPGSDRLVLSEGHAVPIVYAAGADLGIAIGKDASKRRPMTREDAMQLRAIGSEIEGHPNPLEGFPFFDAATGSLGQGLSVAAGLGLAARVDGIGKRIYCLIGDGESREGQIWEAVDFIAENKLASVCPIFNCNAYGQSEAVGPPQTPEVTAKKLEAVGFEVKVIDGHDPQQVREALAAHAKASDVGAAPVAIVAKTVKGWGAPSMHGEGLHGKPIAGEPKDKALAELDATAKELGATWSEGDLSIPAVPGGAPEAKPASKAPGFEEAMKQFGKEDVLSKGKWATRRAYGVALQALGHADQRVVELDGDVKNSTFAELFAKDPALSDRYFECRIAEQNMISAAAGLSAGGKVPFASTFAKFVTRAYDQLEMAVYSGANLKVVGSHAGVSLGADGPSQMSLPDMAWFRSWSKVTLPDGRPAMYLLQPADAYAAYGLTVAMAEHNGACYMRTHRPGVPFYYDDSTPFELGGHHVLKPGKDLLIVASGYTVFEAHRAMDGLKSAGIDATLVDLYSLPFDEAAIVDLARQNNSTVLSVEDNYDGAIGSAVADALAADGGECHVRQMHVTRVPKSGRSPDDVMKYVGLDAQSIVTTAQSLMEVASP